MAIHPLTNGLNHTPNNGGITLPIHSLALQNTVLSDETLSQEPATASEAESVEQVPNTSAPKINFAIKKDDDDEANIHKSGARYHHDNLARREALLKGKEGSRRRQRWENDRLLGNPFAQPPLPCDWEVRPTYPIRSVPYYLAPLWDEMAKNKNISSNKTLSKNKGSPRQRMLQDRARHEQDQAARKVSRQIKEKLKRARSAKWLLQDLEEEVRRFVKYWEEREKEKMMWESGHDGDGLSDQGMLQDSEDEEIVFVGRNGQMDDLKSPRLADMELDIDSERDKLIFDSAIDDQAASFGRWLVHSIGVYYGLQTWSVTVGDPARREAYVSIPEWKQGLGRAALEASSLPQPLWCMI